MVYMFLFSCVNPDKKDDVDMTRHLRNVIFRIFHHCSAKVYIKVNILNTYCDPYCSH